MQLPGTNPNFRRTLKDASNLHVKFSFSNMRFFDWFNQTNQNKENKYIARVFKVEINVHIFKDADSILYTSPHPVCRRIIFHSPGKRGKPTEGLPAIQSTTSAQFLCMLVAFVFLIPNWIPNISLFCCGAIWFQPISTRMKSPM